ncbi:MAG: YfhO family protein [Muribaculaceae bacterium]
METEMNRPNIIGRILRSKRTLYHILAIAIFAIIAWAYFMPDVIEGNVLKQHDVQQGMAIGEEGRAFNEKSGEVTRWTNSLFSGMPNFQISPTYESSKLISWVGKVYSLGFPSPVNILFIMMIGFYIMLIAFKVKWYIAIPGAIAYAFSTYFFIIIGAGHIWKYITLAYIPPTIAGIVWCYRGKLVAGGAVAAFFATLQIASNHVQMTYYFLFVIVALMIAYLAISIKNKSVNLWWKSTLVLIGAAILAVVANSPNLYNTYKYSKESMRGGHSELVAKDANTSTGGLNKDYITNWSYGIDETLSLLIPNIKGGATIKPKGGNNELMSLADTDKANDMSAYNEISPTDYQYLQNFPQYFGDQPMTNGPVYVGALVLVLFFIGCFAVKGAVKWSLLAVTVLSILLAWGHNFMFFTDLFIDYFPMYNKFRAVSSALVIAEFTIPLLAILALQRIFTDKEFITKHINAIYVSFAIPAAICLIGWLMPSIFGSAFSAQETEQYILTGQFQQVPTLYSAIETVRYSLISNDALRSFFIILFGFIVLWAYSRGYMKSRMACVVITIIILGDLFTVNKRYISSESFSSVPLIEQPKISPRNVDRKILADTTMNYRVLDVKQFGEATPSYFHKMIGGYHAAKLMRYQDLIEHQIMNNNMAVLNMLNTKYVIIDDENAQLNTDALGNGWFVNSIKYVNTPQEEMQAITNFNPSQLAVADKKFAEILGDKIAMKVAGDTIYETKYAPNELTYHATSQNGGLAVFSEIYFPWGWHATIDGKDAEIGRVNYVLRALKIPAGNHTINFRFEPESVKTTETIAYIAIAIIYLAMIVAVFGIGRKKERKDKIID